MGKSILLKRLSAASALAITGTMLAVSTPAIAAERSIIVFDGSGSMWGQINGVNKIVTAREAVSKVLPTLPPNMELGLIAYGHNRKGDCSDIQTLVQPGPVTQTAAPISQAVGRLNPKGKTPLSDAVRQAAEQLRYTEDAATVILITDGLETCNADPCALGRELEQAGVGFTAHVIGFGLTEEEGRQVSCLAENTGGRYIPANDADTLGEALTETVALRPEVLPPEPEPERPTFNLIARAALNEGGAVFPDAEKFSFQWALTSDDPAVDPTQIPQIGNNRSARTYTQPGTYTLTARYGQATGSVVVDLEAFDTTEVTVPLNAGRIDAIVIPLNPSLALDDQNYKWSLRNLQTQTVVRGFFNRIDEIVPAGDYEIIFHPGKLDAIQTSPTRVTVGVGETLQTEVVAPVSRVTLTAAAADGRELSNREVVFRVFNDQGKLVTDSFGTLVRYLTEGQYRLVIEYRLDGKREQVEEMFEIGPAEDRQFAYTYRG
ncbi:MAG: VWA domain-containing protein [Pseudomonadota bacterium]